MSIEDNKLIAEFMEYQHSAYPEIDKWEMDNLKYHSSWDCQIPVWSKISHITQKLAADSQVALNWHLRWTDQYESAIFQNKPEEGFKVIAKAITWYNTQNK